jgi:hypothetical protein
LRSSIFARFFQAKDFGSFFAQTHAAIFAFPQTPLPRQRTAYRPILYCWPPVA